LIGMGDKLFPTHHYSGHLEFFNFHIRQCPSTAWARFDDTRAIQLPAPVAVFAIEGTGGSDRRKIARNVRGPGFEFQLLRRGHLIEPIFIDSFHYPSSFANTYC
jgi:hypothetical protein